MKKKVKEKPVYLVWLDWPIGAFRLNARSLAVLRACAGGSADIRTVRSERAFLRALPEATHALVWEFKTAWFARAKRLRVLATPGAGREWLPADDEMPSGIVRVNGAFHGAIMSETVIACLFAHARGLYPAAEYQRAGTLWPRAEMSPFCTCVAGTKAVILGYGKIGRATGAKLEALGVTVTGIGRRNVDALLSEVKTADWLITVLPSDTGTDGLVSAKVLRAMKKTAVLVNIGRGNAVDEAALADALKRRRIAAAFLDVYAHEPLTADSPLAENLPGLVRLPHMSAFSPDYLPLFFRELEREGWLT